MKLNVTAFAIAGSDHAESEDRFEVKLLENGGVLCVLADGVGGGRDSRRCAERVVRLVVDNFAARPRQWPIQKAFERLIDQANSSLYQEGVYIDGTASMQTTVAAVCLVSNRLHGVNVGDSPVLLVRGEITERLSQTHSAVNGDGKDILTNAVGMGPPLCPHYFEREVKRGDLIVVTSDGLTKLLDDAALGAIARQQGVARGMVQAAVACAGEEEELDDIAAVLVEVSQLDAPALAAMRAAVPMPKPAKDGTCGGFRLLRPMRENRRVWLAEKDGKHFVIKFVPLEAETDDSGVVVARFAREAWTASRLDSDFFIPSHLPEDGNPYYYAMDYIDSPVLGEVLVKRKLSVDEAIELGQFLCRAEQFLLQQELVHGDIKPDNLLIRREPGMLTFKLLDLGLATPVFTDPTVSGTPAYMAPERFRGAVATERTEIYSIGATLYEALTQRPPFGRIERFQSPDFSRWTRPSRLNPYVPPWVDGLLGKCLSIDPEKRYQCYSELLYAIEHPEEVLAHMRAERPLLERNPSLFYKIGFWLLFVVTVVLLIALLQK